MEQGVAVISLGKWGDIDAKSLSDSIDGLQKLIGHGVKKSSQLYFSEDNSSLIVPFTGCTEATKGLFDKLFSNPTPAQVGFFISPYSDLRSSVSYHTLLSWFYLNIKCTKIDSLVCLEGDSINPNYSLPYDMFRDNSATSSQNFVTTTQWIFRTISNKHTYEPYRIPQNVPFTSTKFYAVSKLTVQSYLVLANSLLKAMEQPSVTLCFHEGSIIQDLLTVRRVDRMGFKVDHSQLQRPFQKTSVFASNSDLERVPPLINNGVEQKGSQSVVVSSGNADVEDGFFPLVTSAEKGAGAKNSFVGHAASLYKQIDLDKEQVGCNALQQHLYDVKHYLDYHQRICTIWQTAINKGWEYLENQEDQDDQEAPLSCSNVAIVDEQTVRGMGDGVTSASSEEFEPLSTSSSSSFYSNRSASLKEGLETVQELPEDVSDINEFYFGEPRIVEGRHTSFRHIQEAFEQQCEQYEQDEDEQDLHVVAEVNALMRQDSMNYFNAILPAKHFRK